MPAHIDCDSSGVEGVAGVETTLQPKMKPQLEVTVAVASLVIGRFRSGERLDERAYARYIRMRFA